MESYVKNEWGYSIFMSGLTNNKRGVMILLNNIFQHDRKNCKRSKWELFNYGDHY